MHSFWTPERVDQLRKLRAAGRTFTRCAAELHTSRNAIAGKVKRLGWSATGRTYTAPKHPHVVPILERFKGSPR